MNLFATIKESLLHLAFPHVCEGCGNDNVSKESVLCIDCLSSMPQTAFHLHSNNPIEKMFWGRLPVTHATAQYYFNKESLMQHLIHQVKYRNNKELGLYLGRLMGNILLQSNRFNYIDAIIPLPLHISKERKRGYNQSTVLCNGMAEILGKPVITNAIIRNQQTETQTRKSRIERVENMKGKFELLQPSLINNKHILLVDDIITTGATLEACGKEILKGENVQLSLAAFCYASKD